MSLDPKLVLLDGASASGKSSFKNALLANTGLNFRYVRRFTTRTAREDDHINDDYIFISEQEFQDLEQSKALIEYRHFLFGMSYGIGSQAVRDVLTSGHNALGLMNLGNVEAVKKAFPSSICVLIDAPLEDIKKRLESRAWHTSEQVEERLRNAADAKLLAGHYDIVVENREGRFDEAILGLIKSLQDHGVAFASC